MKNNPGKRKIKVSKPEQEQLNQTEKDWGRKDLNTKKDQIRKFLANEETKRSRFTQLQDQSELLRSVDRYADLYEYAPLGYMSLDNKGVITDINLTGANMLWREKKHIINIPFISFLETSEIRRFMKHLKECMLRNMQIVEDFRIKTKGADPVYLKLFITPFPDYASRKLYYRVLMYDNSEKIKAEKALKEIEHRFSDLADTIPVLIWMFDKEQKLEYINRQRFQFTGLSAEQEGNNWFEIIHPQDKEQYVRKYKEAFKSHKRFSIEYRLRNHNNEYHWLLETTIPRFNEDNEFIGLICTGIDITERKKARMSVENSLKEKELLIKEIHHRVKNNLQIVSSLLNLQSFYVKDQKLLDLLKGSQERIRSMALVHEKLYRSKDLLKIDFEDYSKELITHLFQSYRRTSNIRLNLNIPKVLLEINTAISLGLIINELVSNALKYAFNGRKEGEISVTLLHPKKNNLELIISDDGVGFPKDFTVENSEGMGLELVESLVQQHNGTFDLIKDGKTEIRISIEKEKGKSNKKENSGGKLER